MVIPRGIIILPASILMVGLVTSAWGQLVPVHGVPPVPVPVPVPS